MGVYDELGLRPILNASATLTRLGGSRMAPEVLAAMTEASRSFVDMFELQQAVSREIATSFGVPAAYVSSGAAAGIVLSLWGSMTGADLVAVSRFVADPESWPVRDVIVLAGQRNPYDRVLAVAHARLVTVGDTWQTADWELEAAITERTSAVLYFAGSHLAHGALPLDDVVRIAHEHDLPVVVDAAAQALPVGNMRELCETGADIVLFSGGKAIAGPQATGLILGRADLVAAIEMHGAPHQRLGRPMKVGKEELVGLLVAIRRHLARDERAEREAWEVTVANWIARLGHLAGVTAQREFPGEAGLPIPRARLTLDPHAGLDAVNVEHALLTGDPAVAVMRDGRHALLLAPDLVTADEAEIVAERVAACLTLSRADPGVPR